MHMQDFCFNSVVVRSLVLAARRHGAIGSYGVSGIGTVRKNYVEHANCHVTIDASLA